MAQELTTALMRIKCSGTTHKECSMVRNAVYQKNKNNLVDLYIVKNKKANNGFCMIANATGTPEQFENLQHDLNGVQVKTSHGTIAINKIQVVLGI